MKKIIYVLLILVFQLGTAQAQTYLDSTASVSQRVSDLLARMTLDEKIGQMIQVDKGYVSANKNDITGFAIGSLLSGGGSGPAQNNPAAWADMYDDFQSYALKTRLKIPLIYGIDAVHGNNNVRGATIFPHNIGLGCTHNEKLVRAADSIAAIEVAATGIDWTFAPCIAVPQNERWGRTYEGFGETPELTEIMSRASVLGFQGNDTSAVRILACAKHYLADGGTQNGTNEGNAVISESELRRIHMPGYIEAIKNGVGSVMASFSSWNGQKMHGNKYLLTDVLKGELGFKGFVVSDWAGIDQLPGDFRSDVKQSVNAGIDMVMLPDRYQLFSSTLKDLVNSGEVSESRINDAVERILRKKFELGLFEKPYTDRNLISSVGSTEHREIARQCVRESLVLLKKKDGILPLSKSGQKILVAGKGGNDIGMQCGGWTISWQGSMGDITPGTTVFEAVQNAAGISNVTFDRDAAVTSGFNTAVVVIGEKPYAESGGDRTDLSLDADDIALVKKVKLAGLKTIVILFSGRPMIINSIIPYSDAVIAAWLPGTEGDGIADILFGDFQPYGTLSHSWPASMEQVPINFGDANYHPLFPLNYGINSLSDSPNGSSPEYYASAVSADGTSISISFNKKMLSPAGSAAGFKVISEGKEVPVNGASLNAGDNTVIDLMLSENISAGSAVTVEYSGAVVSSSDGGVLKAFGPETVLNESSGMNSLKIPGTIQAEDYSAMSGVQTENTTDTGGGLNVGWIDSGDWMEYNVNISASGNYNVTFRVAALSSAGKISLKSDGQTVSVIDIPVTGGWQNWQSVSRFADLTAGARKIRIEVSAGGFNLNWFSFDALTSVDKNVIPERFELMQNYPNPFNPETIIKFSVPAVISRGVETPDRASLRPVSIKVYDVLGREVATLVNERKEPGEYSVDFNAADLPSGIYFYRLSAGSFSETKKMLLLR